MVIIRGRQRRRRRRDNRGSVHGAAGARRSVSEVGAQILCHAPSLIREALLFRRTSGRPLGHLRAVEDQEAARAQLAAKGLVAFVADGSILPRSSGASDQPMARADAVPFASPPSLRVRLPVPNADSSWYGRSAWRDASSEAASTVRARCWRRCSSACTTAWSATGARA